MQPWREDPIFTTWKRRTRGGGSTIHWLLPWAQAIIDHRTHDSTISLIFCADLVWGKFCSLLVKRIVAKTGQTKPSFL